MTVTAADVRRLLSSRERDATMVLHEGRVEIVGAGDLEDGPYRGALWITSRADLVDRAGHGDLDERELAEQAANLDAAVTNLGG